MQCNIRRARVASSLATPSHRCSVHSKREVSLDRYTLSEVDAMRRYNLNTTCEQSWFKKNPKDEEITALARLAHVRVVFTKQRIKETLSCKSLCKSQANWSNNNFFVGVIGQHPWMAHSNLVKIFNDFVPRRMNLTQWSFETSSEKDKVSRFKLPFVVLSAPDFYPFHRSFGDGSKTGSNRKKKASSKSSGKKSGNKRESAIETGSVNDKPSQCSGDANFRWKVVRNKETIGCVDSVGEELPMLVREYVSKAPGFEGKKMQQKLIIFRERPQDLRNIKRMNRVLNVTDPDGIIFDRSKQENISRLFYRWNKFGFLLRIYLAWILESILGWNVFTSMRGGHHLMVISKLLFRNELSSYAMQSAVNYGRRHSTVKTSALTKPTLIFGDLHWKYFDTVKNFLTLFDMHCLVALSQFGLVNDKIYYYANYQKVPLAIWDLIGCKLKPHLTMMNTYGNDVLSVSVNECDPHDFPVLVCVCHAARVGDLISILTGQRKANRWIAEVNHKDEYVVLNKMLTEVSPTLWQHKLPDEKEIESRMTDYQMRQFCHYFGVENAAFILTPISQDSDIVSLKAQIERKSEELKLKYIG